MPAGNLEQIRKATEELTPLEKAALADILLSDAGMSEDVDKYWRNELKHRSERLLAGNVKTISFAEFRAKHETDQSLDRG